MKFHRKCVRYANLVVVSVTVWRTKCMKFHKNCARYANLVVCFSHGMESKLYEIP